jgi:hypothetical protein
MREALGVHGANLPLQAFMDIVRKHYGCEHDIYGDAVTMEKDGDGRDT